MCIRALGIMLSSPAGTMTALLDKETSHYISPWPGFDSQAGESLCVVHTAHESVREEVKRRAAAKVLTLLPPDQGGSQDAGEMIQDSSQSVAETARMGKRKREDGSDDPGVRE